MGMNISDFFDMDVLIQILTDWSTCLLYTSPSPRD